MTGKDPASPLGSVLPGFLTLCLVLWAPRLAPAQFTVTGTERPITASLGGEAVLSCHLSPRMSAESMEVKWSRSRFSEAVHVYRDGQDQFGEQMPEYRGRTELLKDNITDGKVSLRIRDIRPSDNGPYKCLFQSSDSHEDASLELQVAGLGSDPDIAVEGHQDGGVRLVCRSSGWFPEPQAEWRDQQGQRLPSASESSSQEAGGLFGTEIAIVLTERSSQKVSCRVRNPRLNQERESAVSIAELFFPRTNHRKVALWVTLALLAGLIALASYCFWRQHQAQGKLQANLGKLQEEPGWRCAQLCAVDVTLDPDTAHPKLVLSEDRQRGGRRRHLSAPSRLGTPQMVPASAGPALPKLAGGSALVGPPGEIEAAGVDLLVCDCAGLARTHLKPLPFPETTPLPPPPPSQPQPWVRAAAVWCNPPFSRTAPPFPGHRGAARPQPPG